MEIFDDLRAEDERIEEILAGLDDKAWASPSAAEGWTMTDVVLHLAQTDEAAVASATGDGRSQRWLGGGGVDERMDEWVAAERTDPATVFERWKVARRVVLETMRSADPSLRIPWAATPLRPAVMATTRLAEHWAHMLDVVGPLGIPYPDTDRLRHVAWLGHRTLPYAFSLIGGQAPPVFCELTGPSGTTYRYGPPDAESSITGELGVFCRVGAHRVKPRESGLVTRGPQAGAALDVLRNYAA